MVSDKLYRKEPQACDASWLCAMVVESIDHARADEVKRKKKKVACDYACCYDFYCVTKTNKAALNHVFV